MTNIKAKIKDPCPEDWAKMKIGLCSRYCDSCSKDVMDFTGMDRREILEYLLTNHGKKVCGRIRSSQLDFTHTDYLVTIRALSRKSPSQNLSFYLLTLGTLVLAGCNHSGNAGSSLPGLPDATAVVAKVGQDTIHTTANTDTTKCDGDSRTIEDPEDYFLGEIAIAPVDTVSQATPYSHVDVMPEFPGGIDGLSKFITRNLVYPKWEFDHGMEGTVYVTFVVDSQGKVKNPSILRSVEGTKNFDQEVMRVIGLMPDWTPGELSGQNVSVQFNLPIKFAL